MLTLYVDETIDKKSGTCIVAGYLGKRKHWKRYVKEWKHELGDRKSPHLAEMRLGSPRAKDKYGALLKRMGAVPKRCGLKPFAGSICEQDYRQMVAGTALEVIMEGYVLSILAMMDGLVRHIPNRERLEVVFERQVIYAPQRERAMIKWQDPHRRKSGQSILAKWNSLDKGILTEASDYLCYALYQRSVDAKSQKSLLTSPILEQRYSRYHVTKERVEGWIKDALAERGAKGLKKLTPEIRKAIRSGSF